MKILVTGGAGYIGSHTSSLLLARGHQVVVYDNLSTGFKEAIPKDSRFIFGDVRDRDLLRRVMRDHQIEAVIHFAAKLIVPESVEKPYEYYETNVLGGMNVAWACAETGVKALVFSSTAAVYGNPDRVPVTEDAPLRPLNPYGKSKAMVEEILRDFDHRYGVRFVSLRYFNVAGAAADLSNGQRTKNATHLIKVAAEVACGKRPFLTIFGTDYPTLDGTGVRDYIHVEDLAVAHLLALEYLVDGGTSLVLNCGYGHGFSVRQVVETMRRESQIHFATEDGPRRPGDAAEIVADSTRLRKILGWVPQHDDLGFICRTAVQWERKLNSP
ncbi:MAG: UDP-glucose 4-epimerase GalE [Bdellovibrionaceae bacterium]|nr:UDP-glucose 4-epimerase GalE [Pseudobdellovibrionaceae bacterium]